MLKVGDMTSPLSRVDDRGLRFLVIGTGLGWTFAFVAIALLFQLQLYGDGAMFSYAVAVLDVWAFHWHNISGRSTVFLLTLAPAEAVVEITGNPWAGIITYGMLFNVAPLIGLIGTYLADRSPERSIFVCACGSTALLCPFIFGFPTEMWLAHAIFWPALAVSHYAKPTLAGILYTFVLLLLLAFTHEGALVLLFAIVVTLALHGVRSHQFVRGAMGLIAIIVMAAASKVVFPPDDYYAGVLLRAALHFFDLEIFRVEIVLLLLTALAGYGAIFGVASKFSPEQAWVYALGITLAALSVYWLWFDHSIHASSRYYLRTALVLLAPVFGGMAALLATDQITFRPLAALQNALVSPNPRAISTAAGAFMVVVLVHAVETTKFVHAWTDYRNAIATLARSSDSDPSLGSLKFISSARVSPNLAPLSWFSTIPYLSVIVADFSPSRLVIDPSGNYFWLSCDTATQNRDAKRAVPVQARELIRLYSCLHR